MWLIARMGDMSRNFAIFAKIATLQEATFGVQFKSPALWRFFAIFSAIARIFGHKCLVGRLPKKREAEKCHKLLAK